MLSFSRENLFLLSGRQLEWRHNALIYSWIQVARNWNFSCCVCSLFVVYPQSFWDLNWKSRLFTRPPSLADINSSFCILNTKKMLKFLLLQVSQPLTSAQFLALDSVLLMNQQVTCREQCHSLLDLIQCAHLLFRISLSPSSSGCFGSSLMPQCHQVVFSPN